MCFVFCFFLNFKQVFVEQDFSERFYPLLFSPQKPSFLKPEFSTRLKGKPAHSKWGSNLTDGSSLKRLSTSIGSLP